MFYEDGLIRWVYLFVAALCSCCAGVCLCFLIGLFIVIAALVYGFLSGLVVVLPRCCLVA